MPRNEANGTPTSPRDWWVSLGLGVSAASALLSSFAGLRSLASYAGWVPVMAPLLPLTIDAYAMTATRVWLADSTRSTQARQFARTNAIGAILLSLVGNSTDHLLSARLLPVSWVIVVAVGAVPPVVLGLVSHLAVLHKQVDIPVPEAVLGTSTDDRQSGTQSPRSRKKSEPRRHPTISVRNRVRDEAELLAEARVLDAEWRRSHGGRPITRDRLRQDLHIGAAPASAVLRLLRAEGEQQKSQATVPIMSAEGSSA